MSAHAPRHPDGRLAWAVTGSGWLRLPPAACPACGAEWPEAGPDTPTYAWTGCTCTSARRHTVWVCPACGCRAAEGCRDVSRWVRTTVPVDALSDLRTAIIDPE